MNYMYVLHIYTFPASFVPHLKIPRYRKIGFVQQKALMIQIISARRHKFMYRNF